MSTAAHMHIAIYTDTIIVHTYYMTHHTAYVDWLSNLNTAGDSVLSNEELLPLLR
jgi:hypothetical protein